jgi:hypothetical protein
MVDRLSEDIVAGDGDRGVDRVRGRGLSGGEPSPICPNIPLVIGVVVPGVVPPFLVGRFNASEAARNRSVVVPRSLVDPERAEHTIATLC